MTLPLIDTRPLVDHVNWNTGEVEGCCQFCRTPDITTKTISSTEIEISCPEHGNIGIATRKSDH